jgi:hypothetical protein
MDDRQNTNVLWWAVPAATVLLLALLAMFGVGDPPVRPAPQSTYDASGTGTRAVYLLLDSLGYEVAQSRRLTAGSVRWANQPAKTRRISSRNRGAAPRARTPRFWSAGPAMAGLS